MKVAPRESVKPEGLQYMQSCSLSEHYSSWITDGVLTSVGLLYMQSFIQLCPLYFFLNKNKSTGSVVAELLWGQFREVLHGRRGQQFKWRDVKLGTCNLLFFMSWKLRHVTLALPKPYNLVATEGKLVFRQRHVTAKFVRCRLLLFLCV